MKTQIKEWLEAITNGDTKNAIAVKSGLPTSTLNRQWNEEKFSADVVISITRAYDASPIEGLKVLGVINDGDIEQLRSADALRDATDDQLLQELARRLAAQHEEIVDDEHSPWNMPMGLDIEAAANRNRRKGISKGTDEEFA